MYIFERRIKTFPVPGMMAHLGLISKTNPSILTGGDPDRIEIVAGYLTDVRLVRKRGLITASGLYKGMETTTFSTGMAPGSSAITLPEIVEACPDNKVDIIRIGTAGALQEGLDIGDIVVVEEVGDRRETTSDKIMGPDYYAVATPAVVKALMEQAQKYKQDFQRLYSGPMQVTNDLYWNITTSAGQDHGKVLAVSMESSVIYAIRDWYNQNDPGGREIRAGTLLRIVDNVMVHKDMVLPEGQAEAIEEAQIKMGLEALLALKR
jgi:uridine phosphorylase